MTTKEYFVVANSFAAPFVSDRSTGFAEGLTPADALRSFAASYKHPAGLYAAAIYHDADAYHKSDPSLARWLSNQAALLQDITGHSILVRSPGNIEIDGVLTVLHNPKQGQIVL